MASRYPSPLRDLLSDLGIECNIGTSLRRLQSRFEINFESSRVEQGVVKTPTETANKPDISFFQDFDTSTSLHDRFRPGSMFTIVMTDPDAPSRSEPMFREFFHYVSVNVCFPDGDIVWRCSMTEGDIILDYIGPGPPFNSGLHRYAFLIFEQDKPIPQEVIDQEREQLKQRGGLKVKEFTERLGLTDGLKDYDELYWFQAEWDASVDSLHEKLGFMPPPQYQSAAQAMLTSNHNDEEFQSDPTAEPTVGRQLTSSHDN